MYLFEAHYIDMETNESITKTIEIEEMFFDSEKEIYIYAMSKAYDLKERRLCFDNLEFIAC